MQNKELVKNWTFYTNTTDIFVDVPTWERWELGVQKLPDFHNSCLKLSNMLVSLLYCQPNIYVKFGSDGNSQDILSSNVVLCCYGNTQRYIRTHKVGLFCFGQGVKLYKDWMTCKYCNVIAVEQSAFFLVSFFSCCTLHVLAHKHYDSSSPT